MPTVAPIQNNFTGGEFGPDVQARSDSDRYKTALTKCENFIPKIQGSITRRSGSKFVAPTKGIGIERLIPFKFSSTQSYVLEFGLGYVRFFKDHGQIFKDAVPYEIFTMYSDTAVKEIYTAQSKDVLYLTHSLYPLTKISRFADDNWASAFVDLKDGPYLNTRQLPLAPSSNVQRAFSSISIQPSGTTGAITIAGGVMNAANISDAQDNGNGEIRLTYSVVGATGAAFGSGDKVVVQGVVGTVEANGEWYATQVSDTEIDLQGSSFVNAYGGGGDITPSFFDVFRDINRIVRIKGGATWGYVKITGVSGPLLAEAKVIGELSGTASSDGNFRLGVYYASNWPSCVTFHEDRLILAGSPDYPQRIDASATGDYENFAPTAPDGTTIVASDAFGVTIRSEDLNQITWISTDEKGLLVGTSSSEWTLKSSTLYEALSALNPPLVKRSSAYGSAQIQPVRAGEAVLYAQGTRKRIRELTYFYDADKFKSSDMNILAEHVLQSGVTQLAYQKAPQPILWAVREDGQLATMTYDRDIDSIKAGWSRQILGGLSNAAGARAKAKSIVVIPSPDGLNEEPWIIVERRISGVVVRYVEYITKFFEEEDLQRDAYFLDCGLSYDDPKTITNITSANPGVVSSTAHGFVNGNKILLSDIEGMDELEDYKAIVANAAANTFELHDLEGNPLDTTSFVPYVSGGTVRKFVPTISGLDHLEGETVQLLTDGATHPDAVVTGGAVTLTEASTTVQVGYHYNSDLQMMRLDAGSANGTALGKIRRTHILGFILNRTLNLKFGMSFSDMLEIIFRTPETLNDRAVPLFTGLKSEEMEADSDYDNKICIRQDKPLPMTILAVMPQLKVEDKV